MIWIVSCLVLWNVSVVDVNCIVEVYIYFVCNIYFLRNVIKILLYEKDFSFFNFYLID